MKTKKNSKKKILTFSLPLQNFKVKHGCTTRFKREIKERDIRREERARSSSSSSLSSFTLSLSLSLSLSSRGKRERKRENCCTFFFQFSLKKKRKYARTQTRAPERVTRDRPGRARRARGETSESAREIRRRGENDRAFRVDFFVFACVSLLYFLLRLRAWFVSVDVDQKENARI